MKTGRTCNGGPKGRQEAVQNGTGTMEGQVSDVNTNSDSRTGQRVDGLGTGSLPVLGSGGLLCVGLPCGGGGAGRGWPGAPSAPRAWTRMDWRTPGSPPPGRGHRCLAGHGGRAGDPPDKLSEGTDVGPPPEPELPAMQWPHF